MARNHCQQNSFGLSPCKIQGVRARYFLNLKMNLVTAVVQLAKWTSGNGGASKPSVRDKSFLVFVAFAEEHEGFRRIAPRLQGKVGVDEACAAHHPCV